MLHQNEKDTAQSAKKHLQKIILISIVTLVLAFTAGTIHLGFIYLKTISDSANMKVQAYLHEQISELVTEIMLDQKKALDERLSKIEAETNKDPYIEDLCISMWIGGETIAFRPCETNPHWNRHLTIPLNPGSHSLGHLEINYTLVGFMTTIFYAVAPSLILIIAHAFFVLFVIFRCAERLLIAPFAAAAHAIAQLDANHKSIQMLAHDVRRPFSMLAIILNELKQARSAHEVFELSKKRLPPVQNTLNQITSQMNEFIRPSESDLLIQPMSVIHIINSAVDLIHFIFPTYARPKINKNLNSLSVLCNPHHMQRVFENILANAFEASGATGQIEISALETRDEVTILISNDGPQIPIKDLPHVFAETYSKGKRNGNGLGLAIAKRYVEQAQGSICCRNLPQKGVEFSIRLPRYQNQITAPLPKETLSTSIKLLIVEDEIIYQDALVICLNQLNCQGFNIIPILAQTPNEGLNMFHEWHPSAIICDQNLGDGLMSGFELTKLIHLKSPNIPILILSNGIVGTNPIDLSKNIQIALKPVSPELLEDFLMSVLERPRVSKGNSRE